MFPTFSAVADELPSNTASLFVVVIRFSRPFHNDITEQINEILVFFRKYFMWSKLCLNFNHSRQYQFVVLQYFEFCATSYFNKPGPAQVGEISKAQNSKRTSKCIGEMGTVKKRLAMPKKTERGTLWSHPILYVTPETFLIQFLRPTCTIWLLLKIL